MPLKSKWNPARVYVFESIDDYGPPDAATTANANKSVRTHKALCAALELTICMGCMSTDVASMRKHARGLFRILDTSSDENDRFHCSSSLNILSFEQ